MSGRLVPRVGRTRPPARSRRGDIAGVDASFLPSPGELTPPFAGPASPRAAWLDLVLGSACAGCGLPGPAVCAGCSARLPTPFETRPAPVPPGFGRCWTSGEYDGVLSHAVLSHKERGRTAVAPFLARRLALAVSAALTGSGASPGARVALVPVPSRPGVVRARGDDPLGRVVRGAARMLRRGGGDVRVCPVLASRRGVVDQAGLDVAARAANLAGSMTCPTRQVRRLAAHGPVLVVVCDDVVTTGATLVEARRALAAVGVPTLASSVVAAVARRGGGVQRGL